MCVQYKVCIPPFWPALHTWHCPISGPPWRRRQWECRPLWPQWGMGRPLLAPSTAGASQRAAHPGSPAHSWQPIDSIYFNRSSIITYYSWCFTKGSSSRKTCTLAITTTYFNLYWHAEGEVSVSSCLFMKSASMTACSTSWQFGPMASESHALSYRFVVQTL